MQAGGDVRRLAEGQLFVPRPAPDLAHHHLTRMDAETHSELYPVLLRQAGIEWSHGLYHPQPGPHGPRGVIFVRLGPAEVHEQAIAEILGDVSVIAGDHLRAGVLIGPHHFAQLFGVELAGQDGRVHQIAKQHGELPAFGVWGVRRWRRRASL